jgi:hypothetical protein
MGFCYGYASINSSLELNIANKSDTYDLYGGGATSTDINKTYATYITTSDISELRLKFIKTKYFYIIDFYRDGNYLKKCRLLVGDFNGKKVNLAFENERFYYVIDSIQGDKIYGGGFFKAIDTEIKTMQTFLTPWDNQSDEHFYITDNIVDNNKVYNFNGKTYVDICGDTTYRGLACEVVLGDNEVLYGTADSV